MSPQPRRIAVTAGGASLQELETRIAALEADKIRVKDLPLAALQRQLEQDWQPDAGILLADGSAHLALIGDIEVGVATLSFVAAGSANVTVQHGLKVVPTKVFVTQINSGGPAPMLLVVDTITATSFRISGEFNAGTGSVSLPIAWMAIK